MRKTTNCGELRTPDVGKEVTLYGWVHRRRDHGGVIFVDVRDRSGLVQVVFNPDFSAQAHETAYALRNEYVIEARGQVVPRPEGTVNAKLPTGEVEVHATSLTILNRAKTPPFYINEDVEIDEAVRLRYRYLDLRREPMQKNILLRHKVIKFIRDYLDREGFLEIETPILIKSTPEGARDYLVPSRVHPGEFYALPQSPQQLKQLCMVAGFEKYFQIARCFRDEDLRADRQPEFTQLDLEMSFVEQDEILELTERMYIELVETLTDFKVMYKPFPRLSYAEAMDKYGSDKPDLRFGLPLTNICDVAAGCGFKVFASTIASGGEVKGLRVPGGAAWARSELDKLTDTAREFGAKGLAWLALDEAGPRSPIAKFFTDDELKTIVERLEGQTGDLLIFVADAPKMVTEVLGRLRLEMGRRLGLADPNAVAFAWVLKFPMLKWNDEEDRWEAEHHPFTAPLDEDVELLDTDPAKCRAKAHDLVCNGYELASGSIRIHQRELQAKLFRLMNYTDEEIQERFGHMLEAFEYGAPPHGGIAPGMDRLIAILAKADTIREVIAFPKNQSAQDLLFGAPSEVPERALDDLHIAVKLPPPVPEKK